MPRAFDSDDVLRSNDPLLTFTEFVVCPSCGYEFESDFHDNSLSVEDIVDPPYGEHICPQCVIRFGSHMTGWTFYSEAG